MAGLGLRALGRAAGREIGETLFQGAAKGDVLKALRGGAGNMTDDQAAAVIRQVGRATTKETVTVVRSSNGNVTVLRARPGSDGRQVSETVVGRDGQSSTIQRAYNSAGQRVHYDPKQGSLLEKLVGWFR